uniref:ZM domain-containing protein n=1 Tax=Strongyloides papillosus TaxID=174720 RepID=A0A0N5C0F5_STREA
MTGSLAQQPLPSIPTIASYLKQGDENKRFKKNSSDNVNSTTEVIENSTNDSYPSVVSISSKIFSKGDNNITMPTPQHLQYNSPMPLYSRESAEEQYRQQTVGIDAQPIPLPAPDRHFDPTKSKTLEYIKSGVNDEDFITPHFFDKVNQAEAPNVPLAPEPVWAREARARSERARSKTPANYGINSYYYDQGQQNYHGGRQEYTQKSYNNPSQYMESGFYNPNQKYTSSTYNQIPLDDYNKQKDNIYTCGPNLPPPERPFSSYKNSPYYQSSQQRYTTYDSPSNKGYQFGGMDFIDHNNPQFQSPNDFYVYNQEKRSSSVGKEVRPGYQCGGTDFRKEDIPIGYNPNYHGHAAERPRLRSRYDADPRIPINNYVAPNVEGVDPVTLVGDTISNQRVSRNIERTDEQKKYIGTIFAPAPGHTSNLRSVSPLPKTPEPICYSTNVETLEKLRSKSVQPRSATTTPAFQQSGQHYYNNQNNNWAPQYQENYTKEVNVKTLLTDEALKPIRRSHTPDWSHRSHQKHVAWQNDVVDPRYTRPEIHSQEPNWSKTVNQRRNHWENKIRDTEARVQLPASFKVPPPQNPHWAHHANQKHQIWEAAANSTGMNQQQNHNHHYNNTSRSQECNIYGNNQRSGNYHYTEDRHSTYSRTATGEPAQHYETHSHKDSHTPKQNVTTNTAIPLQPPLNFKSSHQQQGNQIHLHTESRQNQFPSNKVSHESTKQDVRSTIPLPPPSNFSSNNDNVIYHFTEDRHEKYSCNKTGEEPRAYETHTHRECHTPNRVSTPITSAPIIPIDNFKPKVNSNVSYHFKEDKHEKFLSSKTGEEPKSYETHSHREFGTPSGGIQKNTTYNYSTTPATITNSGGAIQTSSWNKKTTEKTTTRESVERPIPAPRYNVVHDTSSIYKKESTNNSTKNVTTIDDSRNNKGHNTTTIYSCSGNEAHNRLAEMNETLPIGSISNTISNTSGTYKDDEGKDVIYKRELTTSANPGKDYQLLKEQETRVVEKPLEPGIISRHVTTKYYKKKTVTDSTTTK